MAACEQEACRALTSRQRLQGGWTTGSFVRARSQRNLKSRSRASRGDWAYCLLDPTIDSRQGQCCAAPIHQAARRLQPCRFNTRSKDDPPRVSSWSSRGSRSDNLLQRVEVRHTLTVEDDHFAVEPCRFDAKRFELLDYARIGSAGPFSAPRVRHKFSTKPPKPPTAD